MRTLTSTLTGCGGYTGVGVRARGQGERCPIPTLVHPRVQLQDNTSGLILNFPHASPRTSFP